MFAHLSLPAQACLLLLLRLIWGAHVVSELERYRAVIVWSSRQSLRMNRYKVRRFAKWTIMEPPSRGR